MSMKVYDRIHSHLLIGAVEEEDECNDRMCSSSETMDREESGANGLHGEEHEHPCA